MEKYSKTFLKAYKKVVESEIGKYITKELFSYENKTLGKMFVQIKINIQNGIYKDQKAFIDDFVKTNQYIARIFSQTSEIGLGLETLNQMLEDEFHEKKHPTNKEEYKKMVVSLVAELQQIAERMPDKFSEYMQMHYHKAPPVEQPKEKEQPAEHPEEEFHVDRLQKILLRLDTDYAIGEVADLVFAYEIDPRTDGFEDSYELFLDKCQPEFLQLIWNYLKSHEMID